MIDRTGESVVVLTVSGERPEYLEETLASWARVRGLGAWTLGVVLEPGSELARCRKVVAAFDALAVAAETVVVSNPTSRLPAPQPVDVVAPGAFSPWVWGTWADRWHGDLATRWFDAVPGAGAPALIARVGSGSGVVGPRV